MKLLIASDHAGFELKEQIINYFSNNSPIEIINLGCDSKDSVDYPDFAQKLCINIKNDNEYGILICGTGIGMSISANRFSHIRCALLNDNYSALMTRKHNNANVIALGANLISFEDSLKIIEIFLNTDFEGDRHIRRLKKLNISNNKN